MNSKKILSDQEMDESLKEVFKESGMINAPTNFTEDLMSRITVEKHPVSTTYKPLISKWAWALISVFVFAIFYLVLTSGEGATGKGFEISQMIKNTFSFQIETGGLMQSISQIATNLLSSNIFLSLIALVVVGIIQTFLYQKIEMVRIKQVLNT